MPAIERYLVPNTKPKEAHAEVRKKVQNDIERFLSEGGTITQVPTGVGNQHINLSRGALLKMQKRQAAHRIENKKLRNAQGQ